MRKGEQTRVAILEAALDIASTHGLEGLTIGAIAERMHMSKSGVFAHFGAREELQIAVLNEYETQFIGTVLFPCLKEPRGLPRLKAIFMRWLDYVAREIDSGCIYISGATEYDDRPGPVRDVLLKMHLDWQKEMLRAAQYAIDLKHIDGSLVCAEQLVFEMAGLILVAHQQGRLLGDAQSVSRARLGFERMIQQSV
jgi:AcrR family transcriptional regulator